MNWLDVVIIVALIIFTFIGLKTGMITAILSLAGVIAGVVLAGHYYAPLSEHLAFIPATVAKFVAFAIIMVGIMLIAGLLAWLLKRAVSMMMLGWVNHLGGAVCGLLFGAILCGGLLAIWAKFLGAEGAIAESTLAKILLNYFPKVLSLLPAEFDVVRSFFE